ncbi:MAG: ABC transporter ATP-binding protein/permease [Anaeroplasmataceae bacterium]|nr:ABC transporter ATP-binding protein/permease [Anaeroplasmataceae bacterium]
MIKLLRYFKSHLLLFIIAMFISILIRLLLPMTAIVEQKMIDFITIGNFTEFQKSLLMASSVVIASILLYFIDALVQKRFQVRFEEELRNDLYDAVMQQSIVQFNEKDTSEQMSYIKNHSSTIASNLASPIFILVGYAVMGICVLFIMLYYSPLIALISIICAICSAIPPLFFNRKLGDNLKKKLKKDAAMTLQLKESLNGHETVTSYGTIRCIRERFFLSSRDMTNADYKMQIFISLMQNVAQVAQKITWFIAFLFTGYKVARGEITLGTMIMFITLFGEFNACVTLLAQTIPILLSTRPSIKEALKIIDSKNVVFTGEKTPSFESMISVRNLSFCYSDEIPVIKDLNLTIHKNEKIALIGDSGSGKSTLIKLLSGYYVTYTGDIYFDDVELHEIDLQELRNYMTVIHQNTFIFNDSIRFNICLGDSFPDDKLQDALHRSGIDKFLMDVPGGLDGACGENGSFLSGGQRQRIALARAIIRGIQFLVIDEGVSAIDVETANEIEKELLIRNDLTLLTITHRIKDGLIEQYDRVLLMDEGRLIEKSVN